jgi:hypothetical protein
MCDANDLAQPNIGECLSCEALLEQLKAGEKKGGLALDIDETLAWTGTDEEQQSK